MHEKLAARRGTQAAISLWLAKFVANQLPQSGGNDHLEPQLFIPPTSFAPVPVR
jgi:hypothetical protein